MGQLFTFRINVEGHGGYAFIDSGSMASMVKSSFIEKLPPSCVTVEPPCHPSLRVYSSHGEYKVLREITIPVSVLLGLHFPGRVDDNDIAPFDRCGPLKLFEVAAGADELFQGDVLIGVSYIKKNHWVGYLMQAFLDGATIAPQTWRSPGVITALDTVPVTSQESAVPQPALVFGSAPDDDYTDAEAPWIAFEDMLKLTKVDPKKQEAVRAEVDESLDKLLARTPAVHRPIVADFIAQARDILYVVCGPLPPVSESKTPPYKPALRAHVKKKPHFITGLNRRVRDGLKLEYCKKLFKDMHDNDFLAPGKITDCISPIFVIGQRGGKYRCILDAREVNTYTDHTPQKLPSIKYLLERMRGARLFSIQDEANAFGQIPIHEDSQYLYAIVSPIDGKIYRMKRAGFGPASLPGIAQRYLQEMYAPLALEPYLVHCGYIDDNCVATLPPPGLEDVALDSPEAAPLWKLHAEHELKYLRILLEHNRRISVRKLRLFESTAHLLGYVHTGATIIPDPARMVELNHLTVANVQTPKTLHTFLGCANYVREYIASYSVISAPLYDLVRSHPINKPFKGDWQQQHTEAFNAVLAAIKAIVPLHIVDTTKDLYISTDASAAGYGAQAYQYGEDGGLQIIAYLSGCFNANQSEYSAQLREMLAVLKCVRKLRDIIPFCPRTIIRTDNNNNFYSRGKAASQLLVRWLLELEFYEVHLQFHPGVLNTAADCLSRVLPDPPTGDIVMPPPAALGTPLHPSVSGVPTIGGSSSFSESVVDTAIVAAGGTHPGHPSPPTTHSAVSNAAIATVHAIRVKQPRAAMVSSSSSDPDDSDSNFDYVDVASSFEHVAYDAANELFSAADAPSASSAAAADSSAVARRLGDGSTAVTPATLTKAYGSHPHQSQLHAFNKAVAEAQLAAPREEQLSWESSDRFQCIPVNSEYTLYLRDGCAVIPNNAHDLKKHILTLAHAVSLHGGEADTIARIRKSRAWWVGLAEDVKAHIRSCPACQLIKPSQQPMKQGTMMTTYAKGALQFWLADIIGPISGRKDAFLFMIDAFSRYARIAYLKDTTSDSTADAFLQEVVLSFGVPQYVYTDGGVHFLGAFKEQLQHLNITHYVSSPHHHQAVALSERNGGTTMKKVLAQTYFRVNKQPSLLPLVAKKAVFAYNTSINRDLGISPHEALFGFAARTLVDAATGAAVPVDNLTLTQRTQLIANTHDLVNQAVAVSSLVYKKQYDQERNPVVFQIGDVVSVWYPQKLDKLEPSNYQGCYEIVGAEPPNHYIVAKIGHRSRGEPEKMPVIRLRKYDYSRTSDAEQNMRELEAGAFLVDDVIGHSFNEVTGKCGPRPNDDPLFLVQWHVPAGCPNPGYYKPSWEPLSVISPPGRRNTQTLEYIAKHQDVFTQAGHKRTSRQLHKAAATATAASSSNHK